mgnify:CR=1 FL=1
MILPLPILHLPYKLILASNSPRRRELLSGLGLDFQVRVLPGIDESYPPTLAAHHTAEYIARKKAEAYRPTMSHDELVITADTVVIVDDEVLGKPADAAQAALMLQKLSGRSHQVVTGVCLTTKRAMTHFAVCTDVTFKELTTAEIDYYIKKYQPYDKAGAYGIQEWIGYIGCTGLNGSYYNVMGLPVQRIYSELQQFTRQHSLPDCRQ